MFGPQFRLGSAAYPDAHITGKIIAEAGMNSLLHLHHFLACFLHFVSSRGTQSDGPDEGSLRMSSITPNRVESQQDKEPAIGNAESFAYRIKELMELDLGSFEAAVGRADQPLVVRLQNS